MVLLSQQLFSVGTQNRAWRRYVKKIKIEGVEMGCRKHAQVKEVKVM